MCRLKETLYQPLALAATAQALLEVDRSAQGDDRGDIGFIVDSILTQDAAHFAEVFPDPRRYAQGLDVAMQALAGRREQLQIIKYAVGVLELVRLLKSNREILQRLGNMLAPMAHGAVDPERLYPSATCINRRSVSSASASKWSATRTSCSSRRPQRAFARCCWRPCGSLGCGINSVDVGGTSLCVVGACW